MSKNRHKRVNFVCRNFAVFFCFSPIFMWFWSTVIGETFPHVSSLLLLFRFVDFTDMLKPRPLVTSLEVNRNRKEWPGDVNADWGFPSKFPQTRPRDFVALISETRIRKQLNAFFKFRNKVLTHNKIFRGRHSCSQGNLQYPWRAKLRLDLVFCRRKRLASTARKYWKK